MSYIVSTCISLGVMSVIIFLAKNYIVQYITKSVGHHYDKEIEKFKALINERQTEQKKFHDLLMYAVMHENKELMNCKILAIDNLWKSFLSYKALNVVVKFLSTLNVDEILKRATDPKGATIH